MICKHCQRSLQNGTGQKWGICETCADDMKCVNEFGREQRDCSGKAYQWQCSLCQNYVNNDHTSASDVTKDANSLLQAVTVISEKFELVNKIQLPKLNSDLAQIKSVADRIVQQNSDILKKMAEIEGKGKSENHFDTKTRYRRRNINLTPKIITITNDEVPKSVTEKGLRYRTRRRSHLINRIIKILNRKMSRANTPRK